MLGGRSVILLLALQIAEAIEHVTQLTRLFPKLNGDRPGPRRFDFFFRVARFL
jgi:hypothetical protein